MSSAARSYNSAKTFKGKAYSGMRVGASHHWTYSDSRFDLTGIVPPRADSPLAMLTPVKSGLAYEAVKSRLNAAPEGSGATVDTTYHWFIVSELAVDDAGRKATLRGPKFKLAHKRPHWNKFSSEYSGNTPVAAKRVECLKSLLASAPPLAPVAVKPGEVALPSYHAAQLLEVRSLSLATTDTTWIETKRGPDVWEIAVELTLDPAASAALAGSRFLVVADQYATKLNANQYATQMAGSAFFLGDATVALAASNAAKIKIVSALSNSYAQLMPAPKPAKALSARPGADKPITAFWAAGSDSGSVSAPALAPLPVDAARPSSPARKRKRSAHPPAIDEVSDDDAAGPSSSGSSSGSDAAPTPPKRARSLDADLDLGLARDQMAVAGRALSPTAGIMYVPGAVAASTADEVFDAMAVLVPWAAKRWRGSILPRLVWHYQEGVVPPLDALLCTITSSFGIDHIKGAFCNLYRDGEDYTPYHTDQYGADVLSISLGTTRKFFFKPKGASAAHRLTYELSHGDVLIFDEAVNAAYQHTVPKQKGLKGARINITVFAVRSSTTPDPLSFSPPPALPTTA